MTASNAQAIASNGSGLKTYIYKKIVDMFSSKEREKYSNKYIDLGHELEPNARMLYELETGLSVEEVAFVSRGEYVGCSPDGLVGEDGGIEIKSLSGDVFIHYLLDDKIEKKHEWQIQMNLLITDRKWWDLVVYNPNFKKTLYIKRYERDKEMIEKISKGLESGEKMLKDLIERYNKMK